MLLLQFRFLELSEDEKRIIPDFVNWLNNQIYQDIDTYTNRLKIENKIKYLQNVPWLRWISNKDITVDMIMDNIEESIVGVELRNNTWNIRINDKIKFPHTSTVITRFIRFINYGDNSYKGTGMFLKICQEYNHNKLNSLWRLYTFDNLGYFPDSKIIS